MLPAASKPNKRLAESFGQSSASIELLLLALAVHH